ncbi:MAG: ABC transporter permease [Vicinamibacteria bacterium]|nr:ABC transporter permease [Vicinamibacteria bacterium]
MDLLLTDVRHALRSLRRAPGFALTAIVAIGLGLGANTAVFTAVQAFLLRALPFPAPEQLVFVYQTHPARGIERDVTSIPNFEDWRRESKSFTAMAGVDTRRMALAGASGSSALEPQALTVATVSANYFDLLGVGPTMGRGFAAGEDAGEHPEVIVLSDALWRARFGADPGVIGRTVRIDERPVTVIGIAPPAFTWPADSEAWVPLTASPEDRQQRGALFLPVVARLAPGVTLEAARADMRRVGGELARRFPRANEGWTADVFPLHAELVRDYRAALLVLMGAVALILLIACANVANLLLARAASRARELGTRSALGATRGRLVRQLLTESLVLATAGSALGLALGAAGLEALRAFAPVPLPPWVELRPDASVVAFCAGLTALTTLGFGLFPALFASRTPLAAGTRIAGDPARRAQRGFVVAQVGLAFALLAAAGLLLRSFEKLSATSPGFDAGSAVAARVRLPDTRYTRPLRIQFANDALTRLRALPGVRSAAAVHTVPLAGIYNDTALRLADEPEPPADQRKVAGLDSVSPRYFATLGIPLLRGRDFDDRDGTAEGPIAAVISETMARRFWGERDPLGRRFMAGGGIELEVVGIAGDVRHQGVAAPPRPHFYVPLAARPVFNLSFVVRPDAEAGPLQPALRQVLRGLDPELPGAWWQPLTDLVHQDRALPRFNTTLLATFALVATGLAALGLFAVLAWGVERRRAELGVRLAIGAAPRDLLRLVVREGVVLALAGLVPGLALALALSGALRPLLFGVAPAEPLTLAAVAVLLVAVSAFAAWLPARRAAALDPAAALRAE